MNGPDGNQLPLGTVEDFADGPWHTRRLATHRNGPGADSVQALVELAGAFQDRGLARGIDQVKKSERNIVGILRNNVDAGVTSAGGGLFD